jgi:bacterioferritin-associated ferredoxin
VNRLYVRLLSNHVIDDASLENGPLRTLCGRVPSTAAEVSHVLPAGKSCESCLRLAIRLDDVLAAESQDETPKGAA